MNHVRVYIKSLLTTLGLHRRSKVSRQVPTAINTARVKVWVELDDTSFEISWSSAPDAVAVAANTTQVPQSSESEIQTLSRDRVASLSA